jgi:NAD(P)-dependent dehydrogenase (short-subunit alcohol dehydrogenase family)
MADLQGRNIVIAGASSGIGQAIAHYLAIGSCRVALLGRSTERLRALGQRLEAGGAEVTVHLVDLRRPDEIEAFAAKLSASWNRVDVLINAAGVWHEGERALYGPRLHEVTSGEVQDVLGVTLTAAMLISRALLPLMIPHRRGKIINISGTFENGAGGWLHYYVAKKGLEAFTVGLADELRPHRIQVNCISPSDTASDAYLRFFPESAGDAQPPERVAETAGFFASMQADNITGQCLVVRSAEAG